MTTKDLYNKYLDSLYDITNNGMPIDRVSQIKIMFACYIRMFNKIPHTLSTDCENEYYCESDKDFIIDINKSLKQIEETFKDQCVAFRNFDSRIIIMNDMIIAGDDESLYGCFITTDFPKEISDCFVSTEVTDRKFMHYVTQSSYGFHTMKMEVKQQDCDLILNYNDDLPDQEIKEFINSDTSGMIILHGKPGCGKTSYLRYLIYTSEKKFIFLDSSCFNAITDASFIELLLNNKDSVIVLEDCERLLADRTLGNEKLSALLNLSDGILGDGLNFKFICTFNADLKNIDKAILRRGRLKKKYEFKALTPEKTKKLAEHLGIKLEEGGSLPLCDIYNYGENTGAVATNKSIGFN